VSFGYVLFLCTHRQQDNKAASPNDKTTSEDGSPTDVAAADSGLERSKRKGRASFETKTELKPYSVAGRSEADVHQAEQKGPKAVMRFGLTVRIYWIYEDFI
jgi:hypothetical protein